MRIGYVTGYSPQEVELAACAGFDGLELSMREAPPRSEVSRIQAAFEEHGLAVLTVFHAGNYADPDAAKARKARSDFARVCDLGRALGTTVITLNAWVPRDASLEDKFAHYQRTFSRLAQVAEDKGCVIAIENCPHGLANIAWSPANWERIFNDVPSAAVGLEYDPSHLVWQGIDYIAALRRFGERVYAFHAKDTEIMADALNYVGIHGRGWWRFRIPGHGDINWKRIFSVLDDLHYTGDIIIEHEDPVFRAERREEGLRKGLKYLRQFVL